MAVIKLKCLCTRIAHSTHTLPAVTEIRTIQRIYIEWKVKWKDEIEQKEIEKAEKTVRINEVVTAFDCLPFLVHGSFWCQNMRQITAYNNSWN